MRGCALGGSCAHPCARGSGELVGKVSEVLYCSFDKYFGSSKQTSEHNPEQSHRLGSFRLLVNS